MIEALYPFNAPSTSVWDLLAAEGKSFFGNTKFVVDVLLDPFRPLQTGTAANSGRAWRNWVENVHFAPANFFVPESLADLQEIVASATQAGKKVRIGGSYLSFNESAKCDDAMVWPGLLNRVLAFDSATGHLKVEAGIVMAELAKAASENRLSLPTTTVIPWAQAGGAVALGCHGTGRDWQTVSDLVIEMEVVTADGQLRTFPRDLVSLAGLTLEQALAEMRVNLGAFGAIYSLTFQCQPLFDLESIDEIAPLDTTLHSLPALVADNEYVELFWFPFTSRCWIKRWNRAPQGAIPDLVSYHLDILSQILGAPFGEVLMSTLVAAPWLTPLVDQGLETSIRPHTFVSHAPVVMHYQSQYLRVWDMSYALPVGPGFATFFSAWEFAANAIRNAAAQGQYPQNMVLHARFLRPSEATLSPTVGMGPLCCCLEITTHRSTDPVLRDDHFKRVEAHWASLGGRPHWGKIYYRTPAEVRASYDSVALARFAATRSRLDPTGTFLNPHLASILP